MRIITRSIDALTVAAGAGASWLILPLAGIICYDVFCRYALNAPAVWAFDLGYMIAGSYFLLGAAVTLKDRAHIREDIIFRHFTTRTKLVVSALCILVLCLPPCLWLACSLGQYAWDAFQSGETSALSAWNPPIWPFRTVFFVSFVLLSLQGAAEVLKLLFQSADKSMLRELKR